MRESNLKTAELSKFNIKTILDYSVEGKEEEQDFDESFKLIIKTIENASLENTIPFAVFKVTGMARNALLAKLNSSGVLTPAETAEYRKVEQRVEGICKKAHETGIPVLIDAEESWIQNVIDQLADRMMGLFNKERALVFNTVQLYRHDRLNYLKQAVVHARQNNYKYGVKAVRGAYMEKERIRAENLGYTSPIHASKAGTDNDFDEALMFCIENLDYLSLCCGSHNERSCLCLVELMEKFGIAKNDERVYFAQLLGMSDHISFNLSDAGYNVAKYVPFGPVYEVTPYLIRRAEENTSIAGQSSRELTLIQKERYRRAGI